MRSAPATPTPTATTSSNGTHRAISSRLRGSGNGGYSCSRPNFAGRTRFRLAPRRGRHRDIEQLGLFDTTTSHLASARRALGHFDLDSAERSLVEHLRVFTRDRAAESLLASVQLLRRKRDAAAAKCELDGLLALQVDVPAELLRAWHARIAFVGQREHGAGASIAGEPLGLSLPSGWPANAGCRVATRYPRACPRRRPSARVSRRRTPPDRRGGAGQA